MVHFEVEFTFLSLKERDGHKFISYWRLVFDAKLFAKLSSGAENAEYSVFRFPLRA